MALEFKLDNGDKIRAFINPAMGKGVKSDDVSADDHNKAVEQLVADLNAGKLGFFSFKGEDGKYVIGFK